MRKSYLGKRAAAAVHYSVANDRLGPIVWLHYSRTEALANDLSAQFRTALTYDEVITHDLAVAADGKLWRVVDQEITAPGGASTLRNLRLQEITAGAQAFGGETSNILTEDNCDIQTEDNCDILLEGSFGLRLVAASAAAINVANLIRANPVAASSDRTERYSVTEVLSSVTIGTFNIYRLGGATA